MLQEKMSNSSMVPPMLLLTSTTTNFRNDKVEPKLQYVHVLHCSFYCKTIVPIVEHTYRKLHSFTHSFIPYNDLYSSSPLSLLPRSAPNPIKAEESIFEVNIKKQITTWHCQWCCTVSDAVIGHIYTCIEKYEILYIAVAAEIDFRVVS